MLFCHLLLSRSKILALHFERFTIANKKNKVKIPLAKSLSLSSLGFVSDAAEKEHNGRYHLCGVIHHLGGTVRRGHYTAYAKRKLRDDDDSAAENVEDQWVLFNDNECEKTTLDYATGNAKESNQRNCYMAFYELKCEDDVMEEDEDAAVSNKEDEDVDWTTLVRKRGGRSVEKDELEKAPVGSLIPCICKGELDDDGEWCIISKERRKCWRCILQQVSGNQWDVLDETRTELIKSVLWETVGRDRE